MRDIDIVKNEFGRPIASLDLPICEKVFLDGFTMNSFINVNDVFKRLESLGQSNDDRELCTYDRIANMFLRRGRVNMAREFTDIAIEKFADIKQPLERAQILSTRGKIAFIQNDLQNAIVFFKRALDSTNENENSQAYTSGLINIGNVYKRMRNWDKALSFFKRARLIATQNGDSYHLAIVLNNIGNIHLRLDHLHEALEFYQQSLDMKNRMNEKRLAASSMNNIGIVYKKQGKLQLAMHYFKKAGETCLETGCTDGEITMLINMANIDCEMQNYETGLEKLQLALDSIEKSGLAHLKEKAILSKSCIYERMLEYQKALECYKEYCMLMDSENINSNSALIDIADVNVLLDIPSGKSALSSSNSSGKHSVVGVVNSYRTSLPDDKLQQYKMLSMEIAALQKQQKNQMRNMAVINSFIANSIQMLLQSLSDRKRAEIPDGLNEIFYSTAIDITAGFNELFDGNTAFIIYLIILNKFETLEIHDFEEKTLHFLKICRKNGITSNVISSILCLLGLNHSAEINPEALHLTVHKSHAKPNLINAINWMLHQTQGIASKDKAREAIQMKNAHIPIHIVESFLNQKY